MTPLAEAVQAVRDGTRDAMEFYELFLSTELLIPVDAASVDDSESEELGPGDSVSILVVETDDGPVVPAFDEAEKLNNWAQQEMPYVAVKGEVLLEVLETDLQVALNPNTDESKLFERSELDELRDWALSGIEPTSAAEGGNQLRVAPVADIDPDLEAALREVLDRHDEIGLAYLLVSSRETTGDDGNLLILLEAGEAGENEFAELARRVGRAIRPYFGEDEFFEVMRFEQGDAVSEAVVNRGIDPFYTA